MAGKLASRIRIWLPIAVVAMGSVGCAGRGGEGAPAKVDQIAELQAHEWSVRQMDGQPIAERSRITLRFGQDGRLAGSASCNRYNAANSSKADQLSVSQAMATRMACPAPLMDQEQHFLELLGRVSRYGIGADGMLRLLTEDGRAVVASPVP